jgi:hypothetical protein
MKIKCMDIQYILSFLIDSARLRYSDKEHRHGLPFMEDKHHMQINGLRISPA